MMAAEAPEEEPEAEELSVNVDPSEVRANLAEARAAEELELREAAEKKSEASDRQVDAL